MKVQQGGVPIGVDGALEDARSGRFARSLAAVDSQIWRYALWLVLFAWAAEAWMVAVCRFLPLLDLPDHMARHYLEARALMGHALPAHYSISYPLSPNLGADAAVPLLIVVFGPWAAAKIFVWTSIVLYFLGPATFILEVGKYQRSALFAALAWLPFALNGVIFYGFINSYSGIGLAFLVLTHYLRIAEGARAPRLVIHALLTGVLLMWHLSSWGIYGMFMGSHLVLTSVALRRAGTPIRAVVLRFGRAASTALPSVLLFLAMVRLHAATEARLGSVDWGGITRKLVLLGSPFRTYDAKIDVLAALLWFGAIASAFGVRWRPPRIPWLLLGATLVFVLYASMPFRVGTAMDEDWRLLLVVLAAVLAMVGTSSARHLGLAFMLLAASVSLRIGSTARAWIHINHDELEPQARALDLLESNARILPLMAGPVAWKAHPVRHFVDWAIISKNVFIPDELAIPDQQPLTLRFAPGCQDVDTRARTSFDLSDPAIRDCYDYLWVYDPGERLGIRVPEPADRVFAGGGVTLWHLRR